MTDRPLPHACTVANRAVAALNATGERVLADDVARVHRATCDLVHALNAAREATTTEQQLTAQRNASDALARLRSSTPDALRAALRNGHRFSAPDVPSPRDGYPVLDATESILRATFEATTESDA